jgi:hypothetical protein
VATLAVPPFSPSVAENIRYLVVDEPAEECPMLRSAWIKTGQSLDKVQPDVLNQVVKVCLVEAQFAHEFSGFAHDELPKVRIVWIQ